MYKTLIGHSICIMLYFWQLLCTLWVEKESFHAFEDMSPSSPL